MKLTNKVKNALEKFIESELDVWSKNDGYHRIRISEPEFGHIIIDTTELGGGVVK